MAKEVPLASRLSSKARAASSLHAGRDAHELAVRGDRAGHGGAVRMRFVFAAERIEAFDDRGIEIRIFRVDFRIDHGDQDIFPGRDVMRLFDLQFAQNVLRRVILRL